MHGPTCIFWADLTPSSLEGADAAARPEALRQSRGGAAAEDAELSLALQLSRSTSAPAALPVPSLPQPSRPTQPAVPVEPGAAADAELAEALRRSRIVWQPPPLPPAEDRKPTAGAHAGAPPTRGGADPHTGGTRSADSGPRATLRGTRPAVHHEGKIHRVDPDFGSTLTASNRDCHSSFWVN
jgi:hypothetical protein